MSKFSEALDEERASASAAAEATERAAANPWMMENGTVKVDPVALGLVAVAAELRALRATVNARSFGPPRDRDPSPLPTEPDPDLVSQGYGYDNDPTPYRPSALRRWLRL